LTPTPADIPPTGTITSPSTPVTIQRDNRCSSRAPAAILTELFPPIPGLCPAAAQAAVRWPHPAT
jgi:hypothetical protein